MKEYLKSNEHETLAGKDVSLDDIDIISNLEEEDVQPFEQNGFESRILTNVNLALIRILEGFHDD